jgi:hypothetical protein
MINEHVRENVLRELAAGMTPMDVARKFRLSLVTVGEIASTNVRPAPATPHKTASAKSVPEMQSRPLARRE